jgi:hypothetical protein
VVRISAAAALVVALSTTATAQVATLQIQIVEGEGGVHRPGSRSSRLLTVEITDEIRRPVPNAVVSFHLPEEGPSGVFPNGLRTGVITADERGRASLRSLRWNRVAGRLQIRIIASKEQARAGIVSFQYIAGPGASEAEAQSARRAGEPPQKVSRRHRRWVAVVVLIGGGAVAGALASRGGAGAPPAQPAAAITTPAVTIGSPSITVGKP